MEFDARTMGLIEDVRWLAREQSCPENLSEHARTSEMDSPKERYFDLKARLRDTSLPGNLYEEINNELDRVCFVRGVIQRIERYLNEWSDVSPSTVTEKVHLENTYAVLGNLLTVARNILNGKDLALRVDKSCLWIIEDIPSLLGLIGNNELITTGNPEIDNQVEVVSPLVLVERLRAKGIHKAKELAKEVDHTFIKPDGAPLLSDAELGELLPANPGTIVSWSAKNARGRRLRGKK